MKKLIFQSLAAIGLMGLAYYLNNPQKYKKMAKDTKALVDKSK